MLRTQTHAARHAAQCLRTLTVTMHMHWVLCSGWHSDCTWSWSLWILLIYGEIVCYHILYSDIMWYVSFDMIFRCAFSHVYRLPQQLAHVCTKDLVGNHLDESEVAHLTESSCDGVTTLGKVLRWNCCCFGHPVLQWLYGLHHSVILPIGDAAFQHRMPCQMSVMSGSINPLSIGIELHWTALIGNVKYPINHWNHRLSIYYPYITHICSRNVRRIVVKTRPASLKAVISDLAHPVERWTPSTTWSGLWQWSNDIRVINTG